jgi:hypothetical protein
VFGCVFAVWSRPPHVFAVIEDRRAASGSKERVFAAIIPDLPRISGRHDGCYDGQPVMNESGKPNGLKRTDLMRMAVLWGKQPELADEEQRELKTLERRLLVARLSELLSKPSAVRSAL